MPWSITGNYVQLCPYQYWHFAMWFSNSMGTIHYRYWHAIMPYRYWHCCTLVQYQYGHSPLPILALNCASIGIGISAFWFSTSMGTVHYQYRHSIMVPVLVFTFLHFGSVPVLTHTITRTGIQKLCLPSIGIVAHWFSTSMGIVCYWYWHLILPALVSAFLRLGSVPV